MEEKVTHVYSVKIVINVIAIYPAGKA